MKRSSTTIALALTVWALGSADRAFAQTTHGIATAGISFSPADVTIDVGDSVEWTGLSGGFHTVAEVDDGAAGVWNGGFHSAPAANDFTHLFSTAGTYYYICEPHVGAGMRGTVTVVEPVEVPTVSQWGLTAMVLLILSAGTVLVARQRGRDSLTV